MLFKYVDNLPMINDRYINIFITFATFVSCALLRASFIPKTHLWRHQDTNATHSMCSILLRLGIAQVAWEMTRTNGMQS